MTRRQAQIAFATLRAAFPFDEVGEATAALYITRLERLQSVELTLTAIDGLVSTRRRFPAWSDIEDAYRVARHHRSEQHGLPSPEPPTAPPPPEWEQLGERLRAGALIGDLDRDAAARHAKRGAA